MCDIQLEKIIKHCSGVLWVYGSMILWIYGSMGLLFYDSMILWSMVLWVYCSTGLRIYGSTVYGFMGLRFYSLWVYGSGVLVLDPPLRAHLLVPGDAPVDGGVDDAVQRHAQQVDVALQLLVLVLADQGPQLLVLVLHHGDSVLQRAHLNLGDGDAGDVQTPPGGLQLVEEVFHSLTSSLFCTSNQREIPGRG